MDQREIQNQAIGVRVSMVSILVNVLLTAFKLFAGVVAHSGAMLSDAVHSASDIVSTVVVIIGLRLSSKQSDDEHPYGHERIECVAAIGLSGLLLLTGLSIGIGGVRTILGGLSGTFVVPGKLALAAALISIGTKEWLYQYTKRAAKKNRVFFADGRCVAPPFRRDFLDRRVDRHRFFNRRISHHGLDRLHPDFPPDCQGLVRHRAGSDQSDARQLLSAGD